MIMKLPLFTDFRDSRINSMWLRRWYWRYSSIINLLNPITNKIFSGAKRKYSKKTTNLSSIGLPHLITNMIYHFAVFLGSSPFWCKTPRKNHPTCKIRLVFSVEALFLQLQGKWAPQGKITTTGHYPFMYLRKFYIHPLKYERIFPENWWLVQMIHFP